MLKYAAACHFVCPLILEKITEKEICGVGPEDAAMQGSK